jgi:hypothetical protein
MGIPVEPVSDFLPRDARNGPRGHFTEAFIYFMLPRLLNLRICLGIQACNQRFRYARALFLGLPKGTVEYFI